MTATLALLVVGVVWLVLGVATAVVMGRRGHDPFAWLLVGVMLGPLAAPLAVAAARHPGLTWPRSPTWTPPSPTRSRRRGCVGELQRQAVRAQARLAAAGVGVTAELLLLRGRPAHALLEQATAGRYGLLAVGTRGAGLTPRLLGSVAESLAAGATVPVLLASHQPATARVHPHEITAQAR